MICIPSFLSQRRKKHILLEGDQTAYKRLQSIKKEYAQDLSWMSPLPGDWHILMNFQEVLIKVYFDTGLCNLALASGYPQNSVVVNFTRTLNFLLEVWEALYWLCLSPCCLIKNKVAYDSVESTCNWISSLLPLQMT